MSVRWNDTVIREKILTHIKQNLEMASMIVERQAQANVRPGGASGFKSSHGGAGLRGAISHVVRDFVGYIGVLKGIVYAKAQEFGATIRPKIAKALAVPIHTEAKRASFAGTSARSFGFLEMIRTRMAGRPPLLVRKKKKAWDMFYVLARSVTLPPRPYLSLAFQQTKEAVMQALARPLRLK